MRFFKFLLLFYLKNIARQKKRFKDSLGQIEKSQKAVLAEILRNMSETTYFRQYSNSAVLSYEDFSRKFPIVDYNDLRPFIENQKQNHGSEIWNKKIDFYQWTSGSSQAKKHIPYSTDLRKSFSRLFGIWLEDLLQNLPRLKTGRCYFSVSPKSFDTSESIQDDFDYIRGPLHWIISYFSIIPTEVAKISDVNEFKRLTCLYLLAEKKLEVISVWSPSFLLQLMEFIEKNRSALRYDLASGFVKNQFGHFRLPKTALEQSKKLISSDIDWAAMWPQLQLISCWGDGSSKGLFEQLQEKIPGPFFQAKGLLATEAPLSLPLIETSEQHPLLNEVFYELKNPNGQILPLWSAEPNQTYELILSQKSGLLRYALGDRVRVKKDKLVSLSFEGRSQTSDLVGEKLNEDFLIQILDPVKKELGSFIFLPDASQSRYQIFTENKTSAATDLQIRAHLRQNPHYSLALDLGQLKESKILHQPDLISRYETYYLSKGLSLGDIKFRHLVPNLKEAEQMQKNFMLASQDSFLR